MRVVLLNGASGSSKSTIARHVQLRLGERAHVLFFDSIGVPTVE